MTETFTDRRGRKWEAFVDDANYGMTCVRCLDVPKDFQSPMNFHFLHDATAIAFAEAVKESR